MNLTHLKCVIEIAGEGSISKAAEKLFIAAPNVSRSLKELESDLGITIFERSAKGVTMTPEGAEFIGYAKKLLQQVERLENLYSRAEHKKKKFSVSVPRASYVSHAFAEFSKLISDEPTELFYKETTSRQTIKNVLEHDYKLGIIRYASNYDTYFKTMLEEKGLTYEIVAEFTYSLLMSRDSVLAEKDYITFDDLKPFIEISHADPYIHSLSLAKEIREELPDNIDRKIFIFERASQFDLLSENTQTFMWSSPTPKEIMDRYNLVRKKCADNKKVYKDVVIYKKDYKLSSLDKDFITALCDSRRKHF